MWDDRRPSKTIRNGQGEEIRGARHLCPRRVRLGGERTVVINGAVRCRVLHKRARQRHLTNATSVVPIRCGLLPMPRTHQIPNAKLARSACHRSVRKQQQTLCELHAFLWCGAVQKQSICKAHGRTQCMPSRSARGLEPGSMATASEQGHAPSWNWSPPPRACLRWDPNSSCTTNACAEHLVVERPRTHFVGS
jgi:hypothetical protein